MRKLKYFTVGSAAAIGFALIAFQPAHAAALQICDAGSCGSPDPFITFNVNDFENGFEVNGAQIQSGLGNPVSVPFNEGVAPTTISGSGVFNFSGVWILGGPIAPQNQTVFFIEPGANAGSVSDVLHYTYSQDVNGFGHLDGFVISDVNDQLTLAELLSAGIRPTQTLFERPSVFPFDFSNTNITATFVSDVPEPASLALLGTGLLGFAVARRRKRKQA